MTSISICFRISESSRLIPRQPSPLNQTPVFAKWRVGRPNPRTPGAAYGHRRVLGRIGHDRKQSCSRQEFVWSKSGYVVENSLVV
jgi:hypothetical protein